MYPVLVFTIFVYNILQITVTFRLDLHIFWRINIGDSCIDKTWCQNNHVGKCNFVLIRMMWIVQKYTIIRKNKRAHPKVILFELQQYLRIWYLSAVYYTHWSEQTNRMRESDWMFMPNICVGVTGLKSLYFGRYAYRSTNHEQQQQWCLI